MALSPEEMAVLLKEPGKVGKQIVEPEGRRSRKKEDKKEEKGLS